MKLWKWAVCAIGVLGMGPSPVLAAEDGSMQDLITILRDRGVIDENDYEGMSARNAAYEAQQEQDRMPALSFWGDFRFRSEHFEYDEDETGSERVDRHRLRYRFRLNGKAEINDHAQVFVRLASGDDDPRSTNKSLGSSLDFDTDDFRIDRAYARVSPFAFGKFGEGGTLWFELGKLPNPFTWKQGRDAMIWDGDLSLEGATMRVGWDVGNGVDLFANGGYYVIDENSTSKDPHMVAGQIGFHADAADSVELGGRASFFHFDSLDAAFHGRGFDGTGAPTSAGGNILDGLTGGVGGQNLQVVETTAYLALLTDTDWPVLVYGSWSNNLTAEASNLVPNTGEEDTAWGVGVELGNKKKYVKVGVGYWSIEANAFPSQFIDSDLFDGETNREGWAVYASRQVWKNTDVNLTAFISDEIEKDRPAFDESIANAERVRVQADLVFKFK